MEDVRTHQEIDNIVLCTNQTFRDQVQELEHHSGTSPFVDLPVDLIKSFSIDYMHQSCLGVMRRLLLMWIKGKKETRLTARHVEEISKKLLEIQQFVPREFVRKPRGLEEIDRRKATEFRQFLLYIGKVVLKGILRSDLYSHFMALSVALCILVSPRLVQTHKDYALLLLVYFVRRGRELYGKEFLLYCTMSIACFTWLKMLVGLEAWKPVQHFPLKTIYTESRKWSDQGKILCHRL